MRAFFVVRPPGDGTLAATPTERALTVTNTIALALAILILGLFALDYLVLDWNLPLFIARKVVVLTEWLAFWR